MVREPITPFDRWRLIGRLRGYVGCRFHAMLAAYTQNVPFVMVDEYLSARRPSSKIREFCRAHKLESSWLSPYLTRDPRHRVVRVLSTPASFGSEVAKDIGQLDRHYDAMVAALTGDA